MSNADYDREQHLIKTYNYPLILRKAVQEMQGIAAAIVYDGKIEDAEINLLKDWINKHISEAGDWPLCEIVEILRKILEDGVVTDQERMSLLNCLSQFAAGPQQPETVEGIFDQDAAIIFADRTFMFTGRLTFGTRKKAETSVLERGGVIAASGTVSALLSYLVVGELGSEAWKYSRFGSKIEAAMKLRKAGKPLPLIVRERDFVGAVITVH